MYKALSMIAFLVIVMGSSLCLAVEYNESSNFITNGGAEQNWLGDWATATNFSVSSSDSKSGNFCFESSASGTRSLTHALLPVNQEESFKLGLSYKTLAGTEYLGSVAQVRFYDADFVYLEEDSVGLSPTAGIWIDFELETTSPVDAAYADINIIISNAGVVQIDDVYLYGEALFDLDRNLVYNGDAEYGGFDNYSYIVGVSVSDANSAGPGTHAFITDAVPNALVHYTISAGSDANSVSADANDVIPMLLSLNYCTPVGDTTTGSAIAVRFFDIRMAQIHNGGGVLSDQIFSLSPTNGLWQKVSIVFEVPKGGKDWAQNPTYTTRLDLLTDIKSVGVLYDDISLYRVKAVFDTRTNLIYNGDFEDGVLRPGFPLTGDPDPVPNCGFVRNLVADASDNTTPGGSYSISGNVYPLEYVPNYVPASPGEKYRLVFNYKTLPGATKDDNSSRMFFRQFIVEPGGASSTFLGQDYFSLPLTNGQWQEFSQDFIVGEECNGFDLYYNGSAPMTGTVRIDDLRIYREITPTDEIDLAGLSQEWLNDARPELNDVWNGTVGWQADVDNIGAVFNMHFISTLWDSGILYSYYIVNKIDGKFAVGLATSTDGIDFTDQGIVLDVGSAGQWDDERASFPGVWKDGSTWYMVYEGSPGGSDPAAIGLATSSDGINWTKEPTNPILEASGSGFMSHEIGTPSLFKEGGIWYLFYHGYDFTDCQIGVATGADILSLSHYSTTVPRVPTTASAWDSGTAGKRSSIVKEASYYYMAYEGSTEQPYTTADWSTGLARSTDLLNWTKFSGNPVVPQTTNTMGNDGPELITINGVPYLYVRAIGGGSDRYKPDCLGSLQWDYTGDCVVNLYDFAELAYRWLSY